MVLKSAKKTQFPVANCIIALLANAALVCATTPSATLSAGGTSVKIWGTQCADFRDLFFDDWVTSVSTQGLWILYKDINYYGYSVLVEDTHMGIFREFASIRLAGSTESTEENTLTLYQGTNFQGQEQYTARNHSNLDGSASSLLVTGSTPWTLYSSSNFEGSSVCIAKAVYDTDAIGFSKIGIRSASLGCF